MTRDQVIENYIIWFFSQLKREGIFYYYEDNLYFCGGTISWVVYNAFVSHVNNIFPFFEREIIRDKIHNVIFLKIKIVGNDDQGTSYK